MIMNDITQSESTVIYEKPTERIARLTLNRPDRANAQNYRLLYDLNAAYDRAVADDDVRVIVLAAAGKHFSSGHDLSVHRGWGPPRTVAVSLSFTH